MSYKRVVPRDLFNEAKLLKCLGRLSLTIHEMFGVGRFLNHELGGSDRGFIIDQCISGDIFCRNYLVWDKRGVAVDLRSQLNSKLNYPLLFNYKDVEDFVFNDSGSYSKEFIDVVMGV